MNKKPCYSCAEHIKEVKEIDICDTKIKIIIDDRVPEGEIHMVQNGECTGKIVNIK